MCWTFLHSFPQFVRLQSSRLYGISAAGHDDHNDNIHNDAGYRLSGNHHFDWNMTHLSPQWQPRPFLSSRGMKPSDFPHPPLQKKTLTFGALMKSASALTQSTERWRRIMTVIQTTQELNLAAAVDTFSSIVWAKRLHTAFLHKVCPQSYPPIIQRRRRSL